MPVENPEFEAFLAHTDRDSPAVPGKLSVDRWRLQFRSASAELEIPLDQIEVKLGRRRDARIYFRDRRQPALSLFTEDDSVLACASFVQSRDLRRQLEAELGRRELMRRIRLTVYFFAGCGLVAWLGSLAAGAMVRSFVNEIPPAWEIKTGDSLMGKLEAKLPFVEDSNAVAQLTALAQPLLRAIPVKKVPFHFHILTDPSPNAFALPGGHIVVTTGLLRLAGGPDELLGVIAHETAHVTRRHAFRHLIAGEGPVFILRIFMGGRSRLLEALAYPSEKLVYESFSQEYEREADDVGWDYLVAAHINPHGMIDIFQKLRNYESAKGLSQKGSAFDSHPSLDRRIAWLEAKWAGLPDKHDFIVLTNPVPKINESDVEKMEKVGRLLRPR
ncbi:MAG: M48 family metallopeptidase [Verrucomicrobiota bacterium]|nr:M48 family metallopeptidase [Verrucomicrobiota bacterium]